jgi:hypothetical protein
MKLVTKVSHVLTASVVIVGLATPAVWASHSGDANSGKPDNKDHYMDRNSLTTNGDTAAVYGRDQLNRSVMNATFTGSGDVEIYDGDYNQNDWMGRTECIDIGTWLDGRCDVFKVRFDTANMAGHSLDHWRSLGCHELGHTGGLGHRTSSTDTDNNSCMRSDIWPKNFDQHDLDAINAVL